ncbi:MAG: MgtC/SapB family protein [Pseudomonadota bacterium]|jgi:putative Mg2+ transporter-C (MgtC) family protein|nr:MgtC/SapB family protein [Syntrophaceae bacterium]MBP7033454.1 MgtC/SapB family protein [Syntrophobacterales bacterium]MDI9555815.1 MgtC/SapB family protein [Pseudomonadota bacterium]NLX32396.1 MgtC/SapB family protein [Deltaproteobacteria bacterium]HNU85088.1 MgtC/SapB family protein [Syntrophales bacterium]
MNHEMLDIFIHLAVAMVAGGLIGLERSYYGRPAGFRTHTLVCIASSLLMIVTVYQRDWFSGTMIETVRVDPTRMAQGIMTGIGFLGAGVIMKEGASIRGLTTAASIWITAAIGILAGVGFYSALTMVTAMALSTLTFYRLVERQLPMLLYVQTFIRFPRDRAMTEAEVRTLMKEHGFKVSNMCLAVTNDRQFFEYDLVINTRKEENLTRLCQSLGKNGAVLEFRLCPTSD